MSLNLTARAWGLSWARQRPLQGLWMLCVWVSKAASKAVVPSLSVTGAGEVLAPALVTVGEIRGAGESMGLENR